MMRKLLVILVLCILLCGCSISHSKKEYYCEEGTLVNNDVCKIDEEKEVKMVCSEDAELEDGKCKYVEMEIDASIGNICGKGYSFYERMCISDEGEDRIPTATCPEPEGEDYKIEPGYLTCFQYKCEKKDSNGKCTKYSDKAEEIEPDIKYSCPEGMKYVYYKCRKAYYVKTDLACPKGELVEKKCVFYEYEDPEIQCEEDYKLDKERNVCTRTYYVDASVR
jgi:hypothetical protein